MIPAATPVIVYWWHRWGVSTHDTITITMITLIIIIIITNILLCLLHVRPAVHPISLSDANDSCHCRTKLSVTVAYCTPLTLADGGAAQCKAEQPLQAAQHAPLWRHGIPLSFLRLLSLADVGQHQILRYGMDWYSHPQRHLLATTSSSVGDQSHWHFLITVKFFFIKVYW